MNQHKYFAVTHHGGYVAYFDSNDDNIIRATRDYYKKQGSKVKEISKEEYETLIEEMRV
jgi:hypothetical protein